MGYWNTQLPETEQVRLGQKYGKRIKYLCPKRIDYWSKRYRKWCCVEKGMPSDGATGAVDIDSTAWWVHDKLCNTGKFSDGSDCTNWQASMILRDILWREGFWFRACTWRPMTHLFGGGKARKNGMF